MGKVFREVVQKRIGDVNRSALERIVHISAQVREDRTPSFYGGRSYGKEEAEESYHSALFVFNTVKEILNR